MEDTSNSLYDQPAGPDIDKWEQIDASRKDVLLKLCSSRLVSLYKKMLIHATIEHSSEHGTIAVLTCSTIRALARSLGKGYDFILRCISIFKALGLLQHITNRKHDSRLCFPLGTYRPLSSLSTLNDLIVSTRTRLSRLAKQTKHLYIQHYGDPERHHSYPATIQQLKAACEQLLRGPLNQESIQLLYARVGNLVACFQDVSKMGDPTDTTGDPKSHTHQYHPQAQGDPSSPGGDPSTPSGRPIPPKTGRPILHTQGDPSSQKGDPSFQYQSPASRAQEAGMQGAASPLTGGPGAVPPPSPLPPPPAGRHQPCKDIAPEKEDPSPQKGDPSTMKGDPSTQKGDFYNAKGDFFSPFKLKKGGKVEEVETQVSPVSIIDIVDNNINIISSSSFNDYVIDKQPERSPKQETATECHDKISRIRSEATALAMFVENSPRNVASFIRKLSSNPLATRAAVIDLLVQTYMPDYQGKPRNRGAWLNRAYSRYAAPDAHIPPMVERWLYTQETWQEIEQELMQQTEQPQEQRPLTDETASVAPELQVDTAELLLANIDRNKKWLDKLDAIQLASQIVHDGAEYGYMLSTKIVPDQAVWQVRVQWGEHSLHITSWEHWRNEFAEIHAMLQARGRLPN